MLTFTRTALLAALLSTGFAHANTPDGTSLTPSQVALLSADIVRDALLAREANRIVGLWQSSIDIGPCAGGPRNALRGMNQFHAGGTLTETGTPPPSTRGPGYGVWRWNRGAERYDARMQFLRYLPDGSFDGVTDVHRQLRLNTEATVFQDEIVARLLNPDGSLRAELCGTATGIRVPVL